MPTTYPAPPGAAACTVAGVCFADDSIGCTSAFTATAGTIGSGQTVCVKHTSSSSFGTATSTTLTIGGVSDTFTSTTVSGASAGVSSGQFQGQTVSVTSSSGTVSNFAPVATPASAPSGFNFPVGFYTFDITGVTPGATVTVTFTLPAGATADGYVKCGASTCAQFAGATVSGNRITLTLTDNGAGDSNTAAGTITDPGAPSVAAATAPQSGGGGGGALGWGTLLLALPMVLRRRRLAI